MALFSPEQEARILAVSQQAAETAYQAQKAELMELTQKVKEEFEKVHQSSQVTIGNLGQQAEAIRSAQEQAKFQQNELAETQTKIEAAVDRITVIMGGHSEKTRELEDLMNSTRAQMDEWSIKEKLSQQEQAEEILREMGRSRAEIETWTRQCEEWAGDVNTRVQELEKGGFGGNPKQPRKLNEGKDIVVEKMKEVTERGASAMDCDPDSGGVAIL